MRCLVTGAGGFIGGHLVKNLLDQGHEVSAVDIKELGDWWQLWDDAANYAMDISIKKTCEAFCYGTDVIYNLAADMGGIGFIEHNKTLCMLSSLINTNLLLAAKNAGVKRYFYASSACVYNADKQRNAACEGLKEADAYPAMPEDGYGWEKLFAERMCRHFNEDYLLLTRVARFHNVYGPHGTWQGGREKAPAAICRKVIHAARTDTPIEIWGDGSQTRSFMYIDDCIEGINRITNSGFSPPLNLGSSESISIDGLVGLVEKIAGLQVERSYLLNAPKGVNGRNSDNTMIKRVLEWEPSIKLIDGMTKLYDWVLCQYEGAK